MKVKFTDDLKLTVPIKHEKECFAWLADNVSSYDRAVDFGITEDRIWFKHKEDFIIAKLRFGS